MKIANYNVNLESGYTKAIVYAMVVVLVIITFYPLTQIDFKSKADLDCFVSGNCSWIDSVPYLIDNGFYLFLIQVLPLLVVLSLLTIIVRLITKSDICMLLVVVIYCTFFLIGGWYSATYSTIPSLTRFISFSEMTDFKLILYNSTTISDISFATLLSHSGLLVYIKGIVACGLFGTLMTRYSGSKWINNILIHIFAISIGVFAMLTQSINDIIAKDLGVSKKRFELIDYFANSNMIKSGDNLYIEQLQYTSSAMYEGLFDNIDTYISKVSGKDVNSFLGNYSAFYERFKDSDDTIKIVMFAQADRYWNTYTAVYKCKGSELTPDLNRMSVDNIDIVYFAKNKLFAASILADKDSSLRISDALMNSTENLHFMNLMFLGFTKFYHFSITGNGLIPSTLSISNMPINNAETAKIGIFPEVVEIVPAKR